MNLQMLPKLILNMVIADHETEIAAKSTTQIRALGLVPVSLRHLPPLHHTQTSMKVLPRFYPHPRPYDKIPFLFYLSSVKLASSLGLPELFSRQFACPRSCPAK